MVIWHVWLLFSSKEVHPNDLKNAAEFYINQLIDPIRKEFEPESMKELIANAYPSENATGS